MNYWHIASSILSLFIFIYGIRKFHLQCINRYLYISLIAFSLAYLIYSLFFIIAFYFTGYGINYAVLYHVKYGIEGTGFYEYKGLILFVIIIASISIIFSYLFIFKRCGRNSSKSQTTYFLPISILILAWCIHPATIDLYLLLEKNDGELFWKYYQKPQILTATNNSKNFIYIYGESLERTYFDQDLFPGLIKGLREIEANSISFTNIGQISKTGWTIAGMVASQCGLPLVSPSHGNSMDGMDLYLSGATCIGDLLSQKGYHLVYLGGASLEFAGKGKFYKSHGFDEVLGLKELLPSLPDKSYKHSWGLYDDSLFDIAFRKFENLSSRGEPFGIFLLTLDTHGWENNFSKSCEGIVYANGKNGMLNAVSCSDLLISKFIRRIQNSNFYKNTTIVIASDHLAMGYRVIKNRTKRKNLFMIVDPQLKSSLVIGKRGSTLDIGPTLLGQIGFEANLGLGRNLLKKPSILGEIRKIDKTSNSWGREISKFWTFPKVEDNITINGSKRTITIDRRTFKTPVLVKYNEKLQTTLWFQLYNDASVHKTLLDHIEEFKAGDTFLVVDECTRLKNKWADLNGEGLCYVFGKPRSNYIIKEHISGEKILTANELKMIASSPDG